MELVTLPESSKGDWEITKFKVDYLDYRSALRGRGVPKGQTFTKLTRNGSLIMSDTPAEQDDHLEPFMRAKGSCLINGLGLGMLLKNILLEPKVVDVTVVEISQDLIDLVSPHYNDARVTFICADAKTYKPPKGKRYNMVWHDIWDNICGDNLKDMEKLHRKYGKKTDWQGSWCKRECKRGRW